MVMLDEDDEEMVGTSGTFRPDSADPDHTNSMGTNIVEELNLLLNVR